MQANMLNDVRNTAIGEISTARDINIVTGHTDTQKNKTVIEAFNKLIET